MTIHRKLAAALAAFALLSIACIQLALGQEPTLEGNGGYSASFISDLDDGAPVPMETAEHGMVPSEGEVVPPISNGVSPAPFVSSNYGCTEPSCGCNGGCDSCGGGSCGDCGCEPEPLNCKECEPWRLFGNCCPLTRRNISIRGWLNGGFTSNFNDAPSNFNGPVTFNDREEAQFNQAYVILERPIDTECGWDLGGRVDLLYGSDYRFAIARGLDAEDDFTSQWQTNRFYGLALPQAYGEIGYNDLSVKVGHFYTILGYEVVTAPDNFFYSHAYTFQYGEPFTHTGFLTTWAPNDNFSLLAGATYGWDNFEDVYNNLSFLGGATFKASDGNSRLAVAAHIGDEETTFATISPDAQRWVYSVVYSRAITDRLSYVFQHDNGRQDNFQQSGETAEWYGINQYLFYKINCCWTAGLRFEWFRDDDGARVAPPGDYAAQGFSNNPASFGGFAGNFYEATLGFNYKATRNLTFRPEFRYDWYDGLANALGNDPFDDGTNESQFLAAFDVIWQW